MANESTASASHTAHTGETPVKPPMPKFMYKVANPVIKAILRSPLHGLMSKSLMVLSFQGRKTGRHYSIPVGYLEQGGSLFAFSHSSWSKNFRGGAPVSVRLRGQERRGTATIMEAPAAIRAVVRAMAAKHGEAMAKRMGLEMGKDGSPPRGTIFVEIKL